VEVLGKGAGCHGTFILRTRNETDYQGLIRMVAVWKGKRKGKELTWYGLQKKKNAQQTLRKKSALSSRRGELDG